MQFCNSSLPKVDTYLSIRRSMCESFSSATQSAWDQLTWDSKKQSHTKQTYYIWELDMSGELCSWLRLTLLVPEPNFAQRLCPSQTQKCSGIQLRHAPHWTSVLQIPDLRYQTLAKLFNFLTFLYLIACECVSLYTTAGTLESQKRVLDSLELEWWPIMGCLIQVLGTEPWPLEEQHWAISSVCRQLLNSF